MPSSVFRCISVFQVYFGVFRCLHCVAGPLPPPPHGHGGGGKLRPVVKEPCQL